MTEKKVLPFLEEVHVSIPGTDTAIKSRKCYRCNENIPPEMECLIYRYINRYGSGNHSLCPLCGLEKLKEAQTDIKKALKALKTLQPKLRQYSMSNKLLVSRTLQRL